MGLAQSDFAQSVHLKTQSGLEQPYSLVLLALAAVLRLSVTVTMRVVPSVCWWWHRWLPFCIRLLAFPLFSSGFSLLKEKKPGWPAWTQSGSSSGPSFPSITSRDYYSVLNSPISHVPLPPPHFYFGMTWLELDDKALLESYAVLQEGILCDVFSQKCSAAWQGAPGQRLTVAIILAVRWQMTGLTCCHKGTYGPPLLPRGLRLQAKHL